MIHYDLNIPLIVSSLKDHKEIKSTVLNLIDRCDQHQQISNKHDHISKTDWIDSEHSVDHEYSLFIKSYLVDHCSSLFKNYNSKGIRFGNLWFQQYEQNDTHDWHVHGFCHFTNIYFLELPDQPYKTQVQDFFGNIIEYSANEGDIISFPSCLYHRSPPNKNIQRKTIISYNINFL